MREILVSFLPLEYTCQQEYCDKEQREKHMEERDERDAPEVSACSFLGRQAVGAFPAHTEPKEDRETRSEATPRLQLLMPDLQLVRLDHAPALLVFERENRAYFAASIPDRGDEFFAELNAGPNRPHAWIGNEPSLNSPWAYDFAGAPARTAA